MSASEILSNRVTGLGGVSVGTALALQSALGYSVEIPWTADAGPVLVKNYDWLLINLRTLFRNLYGACETKMRDGLTSTALANSLNTEINSINELLSMSAVHTCKPMFYVGDYKDLPSRFPHAFFKQAGTELQQTYGKLETESIKKVINITDVNVISIHSKFDGDNPKSLIITHLPIDLLSRYRFSNLTLLESHTGKTKNHLEWNSKLTGGNKLTRIPFNNFSIQMFGDGGNYLVGYSPKIKQYVLEVAEKGLWTPATTVEKQKSDIARHIYNPILKEQLFALF